MFFDTIIEIRDFGIRKVGAWHLADVELQFILHHPKAGEGKIFLNRRYVNEVLAAPITINQEIGKGCREGTDRDRGISGPAEECTHWDHNGVEINIPLVNKMVPHCL